MTKPKTPGKKAPAGKKQATDPESYVKVEEGGIEFLFSRSLDYYVTHTATELVQNGETPARMSIINLVLARRGLRTLPETVRRSDQTLYELERALVRTGKEAEAGLRTASMANNQNRRDTDLITDFGRAVMRERILAIGQAETVELETQIQRRTATPSIGLPGLHANAGQPIGAVSRLGGLPIRIEPGQGEEKKR